MSDKKIFDMGRNNGKNDFSYKPLTEGGWEVEPMHSIRDTISGRFIANKLAKQEEQEMEMDSPLGNQRFRVSMTAYDAENKKVIYIFAEDVTIESIEKEADFADVSHVGPKSLMMQGSKRRVHFSTDKPLRVEQLTLNDPEFKKQLRKRSLIQVPGMPNSTVQDIAAMSIGELQAWLRERQMRLEVNREDVQMKDAEGNLLYDKMLDGTPALKNESLRIRTKRVSVAKAVYTDSTRLGQQAAAYADPDALLAARCVVTGLAVVLHRKQERINQRAPRPSEGVDEKEGTTWADGAIRERRLKTILMTGQKDRRVSNIPNYDPMDVAAPESVCANRGCPQRAVSQYAFNDYAYCSESCWRAHNHKGYTTKDYI